MKARYLPAGDLAVMVEFDRDINPEANLYVQSMDQALQNSPIRGVLEVLPTIRSLLIYYDPEKLTFDELKAQLEERESQMTRITLPPKKLVRMPCCYGGEYGPDLDYVASVNGLTPSEVIRIHSSTRYQVYCFGTAPGSPNMGINPPQIVTPRRPTPRTAMPPGTVAIGGKQCVFYIVEIPGGHWMLGRTPLKLFDPWQPLRRLVELGDSVQFDPIDEQEFKEIKAREAESEKKKEATLINSEQKGVPSLEVISPGLLTTVQDVGRYGYLKYGVSPTGAMDEVSLRLANLLVGNSEGEAGLEITLMGPRLRVLNDTAVAVMGGDLNLKVNGQLVGIGQAIPVRKGDTLSFGSPRSGFRAYLALAGGINVPKIMESRSTFLRCKFGGMGGRPLQAADILFAGEISSPPPSARKMNQLNILTGSDKNRPIRFVLGPQDDYFTEEAVNLFLNSAYTVSSQSDRSGCRLEGAKITHRGAVDIISEGVTHGSIQVLPSGSPLLFFKDRHIGGYPKLGVVITPDYSRLAQLKPGDTVRFEAVSLSEAHALFKQFKKLTGLQLRS